MVDTNSPQGKRRLPIESIIDKLTPSSSDSDRFAALLIICRATSPTPDADFTKIFAAIGQDFLFRLCTSDNPLYIDISLNLFSLSLASNIESSECQFIHSSLISPTLVGSLACLGSREFRDDSFSLVLDSLTTFLTAISVSSIPYDIDVPVELLEKLLEKAEAGDENISLSRRFLEALFMLFDTCKNDFLVDRLLLLMVSSVVSDKFDFAYLRRLTSIFPKLRPNDSISNDVLTHVLSVISDPLKTKYLQSDDVASLLRFIYCVSTCLTPYDDAGWIFNNPVLGSLAFHRVSTEFNIIACSSTFTEDNNYLVHLYRFFLLHITKSDLKEDLLSSILIAVQNTMVELFDSIEYTFEEEKEFSGLLGNKSSISARCKLFFVYLAEDCSFLKYKGLLKAFKCLVGAVCGEINSNLYEEDLLVSVFNNVIFPGVLNVLDDEDFVDIIAESGFVDIILGLVVKLCGWLECVDQADLVDYITSVVELIDDDVLRSMDFAKICVSRDLLVGVRDSADLVRNIPGTGVLYDLVDRISLHFKYDL